MLQFESGRRSSTFPKTKDKSVRNPASPRAKSDQCASRRDLALLLSGWGLLLLALFWLCDYAVTWLVVGAGTSFYPLAGLQALQCTIVTMVIISTGYAAGCLTSPSYSPTGFVSYLLRKWVRAIRLLLAALLTLAASSILIHLADAAPGKVAGWLGIDRFIQSPALMLTDLVTVNNMPGFHGLLTLLALLAFCEPLCRWIDLKSGLLLYLPLLMSTIAYAFTTPPAPVPTEYTLVLPGSFWIWQGIWTLGYVLASQRHSLIQIMMAGLVLMVAPSLTGMVGLHAIMGLVIGLVFSLSFIYFLTERTRFKLSGNALLRNLFRAGKHPAYTISLLVMALSGATIASISLKGLSLAVIMLLFTILILMALRSVRSSHTDECKESLRSPIENKRRRNPVLELDKSQRPASTLPAAGVIALSAAGVREAMSGGSFDGGKNHPTGRKKQSHGLPNSPAKIPAEVHDEG